METWQEGFSYLARKHGRAKRKDKAVKEKRALLLKCNTNTYHVESSNSMRNHLSRSKKDTTVQEKDARKGGRITINGLTLQDPNTYVIVKINTLIH